MVWEISTAPLTPPSWLPIQFFIKRLTQIVTRPSWACLPECIGKPIIKAPVFHRKFYCRVIKQGNGRLAQICLPKLRWGTKFIQKVYVYSAGAGVINKVHNFLVGLCSKLTGYFIHCVFKSSGQTSHQSGDFSVVILMKER